MNTWVWFITVYISYVIGFIVGLLHVRLFWARTIIAVAFLSASFIWVSYLLRAMLEKAQC